MKKSKSMQFFLTLFFGPLGLFYSNLTAGIAFTLAALISAYFLSNFVIFLVWVISIFVGFSMVRKYNESLERENQKHQEILHATKNFSQPTQN